MAEDSAPPEVLVTGSISQEERMYAAACHFAGLPIFFAFAAANLLAPLIIWLLKKDTMPLVNDHGKESVNFQLTIFIAYCVTLFAHCLRLGWVLAGVILVLHIVFPIIGGIAAYNGQPYRYPLTLRLVK